MDNALTAGAERADTSALMLITVDTLLAGSINDKPRRATAFDVAGSRLANGYWPIYRRTRYQKLMRAGLPLLFYVAGHGPYARHVIARGKIDGVLPGPAVQVDTQYRISRPKIVLKLGDVAFFLPPVDLAMLRSNLSRLRDAGHSWGTRLQGGCLALSAEDLSRILAASKAN